MSNDWRRSTASVCSLSSRKDAEPGESGRKKNTTTDKRTVGAPSVSS